MKQANDLMPKASAQIQSRLASFQAAIFESTELRAVDLQSGSPGSYAAKTTSFLYLKTALRELERITDESDIAPSQDAISGFAKQSAMLNKSLAQWEELKKRQLPELNAALKRAKLPKLTEQQ
jgi:hypothetical protein